MRRQFLKHMGKSTPSILPVLAEDAFPHQLIERDLKYFEGFLALAADCVVIFVESVGSYAETGLFSAFDRRVVNKTLIVNTRERSDKPSFLNLGPIRLISRRSMFQEAILLRRRTVSKVDARRIADRIISVIPKSDPIPFQFRKDFDTLQLRHQLAVVYLVICLMGAGTLKQVLIILREYFDVKEKAIARYLAILVGLRLLRRHHQIYYYHNPNPRILARDRLICSLAFRPSELRMKALEWISKNDSHLKLFLRKKLQVKL
jgi:hypothetical protein